MSLSVGLAQQKGLTLVSHPSTLTSIGLRSEAELTRSARIAQARRMKTRVMIARAILLVVCLELFLYIPQAMMENVNLESRDTPTYLVDPSSTMVAAEGAAGFRPFRGTFGFGVNDGLGPRKLAVCGQQSRGRGSQKRPQRHHKV